MKYTELAKLAPVCFGCRDPADGTLVLAHDNLSGWGMLFGRGVKSLALGGMILCFSCHEYSETPEGRKDYHWRAMAHQRTLTWSWQNGYLRLDPKGGEPDDRLR